MIKLLAICFSLLVHSAICAEVDLIIFSCDRPLQLYALLESIERYVSHIGRIHVIVRTTHTDYKQAYEEIFNTFPYVIVKEQFGPDDFKATTLRSLQELTSEYILFAVDDIIVTDTINLDYCVRMMQQFDAYGFYIRMGKNCTLGYPHADFIPLPMFEFDDQGLCAWHFDEGLCDWGYPHTVDMTVYKKNDILDDFKLLTYYAPNSLEASWAWVGGFVKHKIGLCYEHSHMVNIPMNRVQNEIQNYHMGISPRELLAIFNEGEKIDIQQFHKIDNRNSHMDAWPVFIPRS